MNSVRPIAHRSLSLHFLCRDARRLAALLLLLITLPAVVAHAKVADTCRECALPVPEGRRDSVMDVRLDDGRTLRNVISARRVIISAFGEDRQALRLQWIDRGVCVDTVVSIENVTSFSIGGIGIGGQTLIVPVRPAREFYRDQGEISLSSNFIAIDGLIGYVGPDESTRAIGADNIMFGGEALIAPFGDLLGENLALALGGGVSIDAGRLRFPIEGHLRFTLPGSDRIVASQSLVPSPCHFGRPGDRPIAPPSGDDLQEIRTGGSADSTVYYIREKLVDKGSPKPYFYVEGGIFLDGGFEGAGDEPSVNPEEYGEYFAGGGAGIPFGIVALSLGYRFNRLNLRTPCPACEEKFVVNTNRVHEVVLKLGLLLPF